MHSYTPSGRAQFGFASTRPVADSIVPVGFAGLEHYQKCVTTIKDTKHAASEFRNVVRKLQTEAVIFRHTFDILLSECLENENQIHLSDPISQTLASEKVRAGLKQRLQGSYPLYVEHVQNIERTLNAFMGRLQLKPNGDVGTPSESTSENQSTTELCIESFRQRLTRCVASMRRHSCVVSYSTQALWLRIEEMGLPGPSGRDQRRQRIAGETYCPNPHNRHYQEISQASRLRRYQNKCQQCIQRPPEGFAHVLLRAAQSQRVPWIIRGELARERNDRRSPRAYPQSRTAS